jgi:hypothetical protein
MKNGNIVFDIDGAITRAVDYQIEKEDKAIREKFSAEYYAQYALSACNFPHYIFPGTYALIKWLHEGGNKIFFFSSGVEERNVELVEKIMIKTFGDAAAVPYKVFSRQHCVDTTRFYGDEAKERKFQSFFYGQKKKKLADIVVPQAEMDHTLLIDDDTSYMTKGEEYNFIELSYTSDYIDPGYGEIGHFIKFHKSYYLAGLLSKIFEVATEKDITLVDAAKFVQIDSEGAELSGDFYYPSKKRLEYYTNGLAILRKIDPTLEFHYPVPTAKELLNYR